jgi:hypothetical protein
VAKKPLCCRAHDRGEARSFATPTDDDKLGPAVMRTIGDDPERRSPDNRGRDLADPRDRNRALRMLARRAHEVRRLVFSVTSAREAVRVDGVDDLEDASELREPHCTLERNLRRGRAVDTDDNVPESWPR